ncbi:MAG TPA: Hpt domain-containing protein [Bauldia sp.]|nr:Hpt domain-containing protein [Bauldia sp.]
MSMGISVKIAESQPVAAWGDDSHRRLPLDLNHLYNQTLGDRSLQREVLKMFLDKSGELVARVRDAAGVEERREAAHALVGSARGIGAFSVAYIASEIELARGPVVGRLKALEAAMDAARYFIVDFLAE